MDPSILGTAYFSPSDNDNLSPANPIYFEFKRTSVYDHSAVLPAYGISLRSGFVHPKDQEQHC